ncbi:MAG TPA: ABC transporter ATP-binding protein [Thermofilum sp.]|nr:ABC transporter ATP-binding protein [Thermofilum sp.]
MTISNRTLKWCSAGEERNRRIKALREVLKECVTVSRLVWSRQVLSIAIWLLLAVLSYYSAHIKKNFVDSIVASIATGGLFNKVLYLGYLLLILWFASYILNFVGEYLLQSLGPYTLRALAQRFIGTLYRIKPSMAPRRGDLLARFVSDLPTLSEILGGLIPALVIQALRICVGAYTLLSLSTQMALLAFAFVPVYFLVFRLSTRRIVEASEEERRALSGAVDSVKESIDNVEFIKRTLAVPYFEKKTTITLNSWIRKQLLLILYRTFFFQTFNSMYGFLNIVLLIAGGYLAFSGSTTVGTIVAFTGVAYNIYEPVANLTRMLTHTAETLPYLDRYREVLSLEVEDEREGVDLEKVESIECTNVVVQINGKRVLNGVDFHAERGKMIGIVGPSGSGKTTFLLTLIRFYEPIAGKVLINGKNYKDYSIASLRRKIVYVPSRDLILKATVFENLSLGRNIKTEEALRSLEISKVDFVEELGQLVNPEKLSDGQRQRLALARAILAEPNVLLLDEALDAVDATTEDEILSVLKEVMKDKIIIVVSHRVSALRHADLIYVMSEGAIVDVGKHGELYERCQIYRDAVARQIIAERED